MSISQEILDKIGFELTSKSTGASFAYDCKFWESKNHKGLFLTDYNITTDESMKGSGLYVLFNNNNGKTNTRLIFKEAFDIGDLDYILEIIKDFISIH